MSTILRLLLAIIAFAGAPAASPFPEARAPSACSAAVVAVANATSALLDAASPGRARDSVEPAERASEPEGVFGFARLLLGVLVAAIVGAAVWLWSRHARGRRSGGRRSGSSDS
jgi:hypothetical protein